MEFVLFLLDVAVHLDRHLALLLQQYGTWVYLLLFVIIFCETGLVVTPFLPGDSLLFVAGTLWAAAGKRVTTVEGLARDGRLHPVQQAFMDFGGFQCGICTPGQIVAAKALLDTVENPTEAEIREWMLGNLCRCTGYYKIVESIQAAARQERP